MKLSLLITASIAACSNGFIDLETTRAKCAQSASSLGQEMRGFLMNNEKKKAKLEPKKEATKIQKQVVEAMPKQERIKEEAAKIQKKVVEAVPKQERIKESLKKESGGFKFPWVK